MVESEPQHLRVLIANKKRDRLELLAQVVTGLGHDVIAREIYVGEVGAAALGGSPSPPQAANHEGQCRLDEDPRSHARTVRTPHEMRVKGGRSGAKAAQHVPDQATPKCERNHRVRLEQREIAFFRGAYQPRPGRDRQQPAYSDQDDKAKTKRAAAPTKLDPELLPKISQLQVTVEPPLTQPTPELLDEPLRPRILLGRNTWKLLPAP